MRQTDKHQFSSPSEQRCLDNAWRVCPPVAAGGRACVPSAWPPSACWTRLLGQAVRLQSSGEAEGTGPGSGLPRGRPPPLPSWRFTGTGLCRFPVSRGQQLCEPASVHSAFQSRPRFCRDARPPGLRSQRHLCARSWRGEGAAQQHRALAASRPPPCPARTPSAPPTQIHERV
ncbi:uncharacterized protein LOC116659963 isoform X2 [Camelus ferus]|uniref:Uncharacterized protein LOC116659963 isoform X2 n=1 Tax=Camelus ferus TaxID=419612 RepID=A0A8B8S3T2_CAMFR|nr:uncharacterized protein LOC116659963 isoform X2 [Camelus ferus]